MSVRPLRVVLRPVELVLRGSVLVGGMTLVVLALFVLPFVALTLIPSGDNEDLLLRNATDGEIVDVVVLREEDEGESEVVRIPRLAPGGEAIASPGLGTFSVEFSDARGRWVAQRVLRRDEDDVRGCTEPALIEVTSDRVADAIVRRKP